MQELGGQALALRNLLPDVVEAETDTARVDPAKGHRRHVVNVFPLETENEAYKWTC